jgi:hypothetical protein
MEGPTEGGNMALAFDPSAFGVSQEEEKQILEGDLLPESNDLVGRIEETKLEVIAAKMTQKDQEGHEVGVLEFTEDQGCVLQVTIKVKLDPNLNSPELLEGKSVVHSERFRIFNTMVYDMADVAPNLRQVHNIGFRSLIKLVQASQVQVPTNSQGTNYLAPFADQSMVGTMVCFGNSYRPADDGRKFNQLKNFKPYEG